MDQQLSGDNCTIGGNYPVPSDFLPQSVGDGLSTNELEAPDAMSFFALSSASHL